MFRPSILALAIIILTICFMFCAAIKCALNKNSYREKTSWQKINIVSSYIVIIVVSIGCCVAIVRQILFSFSNS